MEFKERIATVVWWIGALGALFCILLGVFGCVVTVFNTDEAHLIMPVSIAFLFGGVASYLTGSAVRFLIIGVFWARPKITGPKGSN